MIKTSKKFCAIVACIFTFMPISKAGISIQFDYTMDEANNDFFGDVDAKNSLEAAAVFFEGLIGDTFNAITPGTIHNLGLPNQFSDTWTVNFSNPGNNDPEAIVDKSIPADTIIIYAGGRNIDNANGTLGIGGPWGFISNGIAAFSDSIISRGETGISDGAGNRNATETDFAPGGGSIVFDTSENWHFDSDVTSTTAPTGGKIDFLSVALHELGHVLGIGTANGGNSNDGSWTGKITGGEFTGAFSKASNGNANVTLNGAESHWADGTTNTRHTDGATGIETAMDPSISSNERKLFTNLDIMGLRDIGWEISVAPVPEPSFYVTLVGLGLAGFGVMRRKLS